MAAAESKSATKAEASPAADAPAPKKKKSGIKVIGIVAVLMIAEGAGMFVVFKMGGPKKADASVSSADLKQDESQLTQEILIVEDKFQNLQTGRVWIWETAVYVQVKNKSAEAVQAVLERRNAEISEGIGQIISRAQLTQLKEPERQTINRQISAFLDKVFAGEGGQTLIEKVLIPKCRGFPADY